MTGFTIRKHIAASPETVFRLATDFEHAAERMRGITKAEVLTEGPVGQGTRIRETRVMFGREATEEMELTSFEPPRSYVMTSENHGCRYTTLFEFLPRDEGTEVALTFEAEPRTVTARLMGLLARFMMSGCRQEVEKDLEDLMDAAEGRARQNESAVS